MKTGYQAGDFESLIVWQKARDLFSNVYKITSTGQFLRDYVLRNQLRKATISISSNIAEGYGRHSRKEFLRFLSIANGSVFEVRSQLRLAEEIHYIQEETAEKLIAACREISRLIGGLRRSIEASP